MAITAHGSGLCSIVERCAHHTHKPKIVMVTRPRLAGQKHKWDAFYTVDMSLILCRDVVRPLFVSVETLPGSDQNFVLLARQLFGSCLSSGKKNTPGKTPPPPPVGSLSFTVL